MKRCFEQVGFSHVGTCIQSGNVIFESRERSTAKLTAKVDKALSQAFAFDPRTVVLSQAQLKAVLAEAPRGWKRSTDWRRNIAFLRRPLTPSQAMRAVEVRPGVDLVTAGPGVLYMSTPLSHLSRSKFPRLVGTPTYRGMTIRSFSTCQKIAARLDEPLTARAAVTDGHPSPGGA